MFNKHKTFLLAFTISFFMPTIGMAEDKTYRLPNDISNEEWNQVIVITSDYNACLKEEMANFIETSNDARHVANQVLEVCSVHLHAIQKQMDDANIHPEFTQRFIYNTKNKASRQMLGGIMTLMAQQQAQKEEQATVQENNKPE